MRTTTAQQDTDLQALAYEVRCIVEVQNADATWIRLDNASSLDWLIGVEIVQDVDRPVPQLTVTLARDREDGDSLAPLMEASPLNVDDLAAYAPLLDAGRAIRVRTAVTAPGVTPAIFGDYQTVFDGVIDVVEWGQSPLKVIARNGPGAEAADAFVEARTVYADPEDTVDDVIQAILDDWTTLTLDVPVAPAFVITPYTADGESVLQASTRLAQLLGWVVEDRWSNAAGEFRLTLYEPDRTATVPDWTFGPEDYFDVTRMEVNRHGIRNAIDVLYPDSGTGQQATISVTDAASIARYGRRFMRVTEASDSPIDTAGEATTFANAILSDLAEPDAELEIEARYFWPVQLGDLLRFTDNGIHFDTNQDLAVSGFRHVLQGGFGRTFLATRGSPSGGYRTWQILKDRRDRDRDDPQPRITNAFLRSIPAVEAAASSGITEDIRPDSDITVGSHTENGAGSNLYEVLDEASFDDADFVTSPDSLSECPTSDDFTFEVGLSTPVGTPADSTENQLTVRYRVRRGTANAGTATFIVSLMEGATVRAQWTETDVGSGGFSQFNRLLTNSQYDSIVDHDNLRVRVTSRICSDDEVDPITGETSWIEAAYQAKTPSLRGQYVDLVYEVVESVDELDVVVRWDDGDGITSYSYTLAGIGGVSSFTRLEGPGAVDFFMREDWTDFSVDATPVTQPRDESGPTLQLFLEDAPESSSGGVRVSLTAGGTAYADRFVPGTSITIDTDAAGRPRINSSAGGGVSELTDLTDVNSSTPTNRNVLVADGVDWESRALQAADIQSGTFADARISESSVTQHEAALSIGAGQITGQLPVAQGGTSLTTFTGTGRLLVTTSAVALTTLDSGTVGGYIASDGATWVRQVGVPADDVTPGTFSGQFTFETNDVDLDGVGFDFLNTAVGQNLASWPGPTSGNGGIWRLLTNQGGFVFGADSSVVFHAGDNSAVIGGELGIVAATTGERLWLTADGEVALVVNRQAGTYPTNTFELTFDASGDLSNGTWTITDAGVATGFTINANQLTGTVDETNGGTGRSSYTIGDLLYASSTTGLSVRGIGAAGELLAVVAGVPNWVDESTLTIGAGQITAGTLDGDFVVELAAGSVSSAALRRNGDVNTGLFFPGGGIMAFTADGSEKLRIQETTATAGRITIDNAQAGVNEQPERTRSTAGAITIDWDLGNVCPIRNDGNIDTVNIDDNGMFDGWAYEIVSRYATGGQASITFAATGTLYWVNGNPPVHVLNNVGERLHIMLRHQGSVTWGAWFVAHS